MTEPISYGDITPEQMAVAREALGQQSDFEQSMVDELVKQESDPWVPMMPFYGAQPMGSFSMMPQSWHSEVADIPTDEWTPYSALMRLIGGKKLEDGELVPGTSKMDIAEAALDTTDVLPAGGPVGDVIGLGGKLIAKGASAIPWGEAASILKSVPSPDLMGFSSKVIPVDNIAGMVAGVLPEQAKKFFKDTVATTDYEETGRLGLPSKTKEPILTYHGGYSPINEVRTYDPTTGQPFASTGAVYAPGFYTGGHNPITNQAPRVAQNFALSSGYGPQMAVEYDLTGKRALGFDPRTGKDITINQGANIMPVYLNLKKVLDMENFFTDTALLDEVLAMTESPGLGVPFQHKLTGLTNLLEGKNISQLTNEQVLELDKAANTVSKLNLYYSRNPDMVSPAMQNEVDNLIKKYITTNNEWWNFGEEVGVSMMQDTGTAKEILMDVMQNQGYDGQTYMFGTERAWVTLPDVNEIETIIRDTPMYGSYRERVIPYAMGQSKDIFNVPSLIPEKMEQFYSNNPFR